LLQEILVRNFALIEEIRLEFDPGFNVLTGETGAGKSIIIDALGLALGGRFSAEMIRAGAENALVEAVFIVDGRPEFETYLKELGIAVGEDRSVIIQREVSAGGKNRCRVNGQLVTVLSLAKIGEYLIDIHGQHEHQSLLFPEKQLELLDEYCGARCLELRSELSRVHHEWRTLETEYRALRQSEADLARKIDLLQFQLDEITAAKLILGEDEELLKEKEILSSAEKLYAAATDSYRALYESAEGRAAVELLGDAERSLSLVAEIDSRLEPILQTLREAAISVEEVSRELRGYQEEVQFDPERLVEIEARLDEIGRLKRKYGGTLAEILQFADNCARELESIARREERSRAIDGDLDQIRRRLGALAERLAVERRAGAAALEQAITKQLGELNMEKTQFKIGLTQAETPEGVPFEGRSVEVTAAGADKAEFLVAPNPGEGLKPLAKIASGGELSRIMLALKAILAELDQIPTMVFDEIDVGIGGRTAQAVAEKMLLIGRTRQVISVTHLPQIASMAKHHFYIEKQVSENRTAVNVRSLNINERVEELARMLGGAQVTDTTRRHAREMLTLAERLRLNRVGEVH
jgi:DNA repair protein RecN (Recombination protein N)